MPPRGQDRLYSAPITSVDAQKATFSIGDVDLNDMQDVIEEAARRQQKAELQALEASFHRLGATSRDAVASTAKALEHFYKFCSTSFVEGLNSTWELLGDDFELADEDEYAATDPISFDELMGGCCGDN